MKKSRQQYNLEHPKTIFCILIQKIFNILARYAILPQLRVVIYRFMGVKIGKKVFIGMDCYFDDQYPEQITIEDYSIIAPRAILLTHDMPGWDLANGEGIGNVGAIIIKSHAYICAGAIILPGVTVGEHSIVAAGAVVTKDVLPYTLVAGVPAKEKKVLNPLSCEIDE